MNASMALGLSRVELCRQGFSLCTVDKRKWHTSEDKQYITPIVGIHGRDNIVELQAPRLRHGHERVQRQLGFENFRDKMPR